MTQDNNKINMLLDIDNFYGQREGRLMPLVKCLLISGAPIVLWAKGGYAVPSALFFPLWAVWVVRVALIILGREKERLEQFRRIAGDEYSSVYDMLGIRTVHEDGCIEYVDGTTAYLVVAVNGTTYDAATRAQKISEFMSLFGERFDVDIYVQNITEMKSLDDRYRNVKLFVDENAAQDFIDIIDHNRQVVYNQSRLVRLSFIVKGRLDYWTEIRDNCKAAVYSDAGKAFKRVWVGTREDVQEILNTDIRGLVDLDGLLQKKYATHQYYGSRVLFFDDEPMEDDVVAEEETGFMIEND